MLFTWRQHVHGTSPGTQCQAATDPQPVGGVAYGASDLIPLPLIAGRRRGRALRAVAGGRRASGPHTSLHPSRLRPGSCQLVPAQQAGVRQAGSRLAAAVRGTQPLLASWGTPLGSIQEAGSSACTGQAAAHPGGGRRSGRRRGMSSLPGLALSAGRWLCSSLACMPWPVQLPFDLE